MLLYAFPPVPLLPVFLEKFRLEKAAVLLVPPPNGPGESGSRPYACSYKASPGRSRFACISSVRREALSGIQLWVQYLRVGIFWRPSFSRALGDYALPGGPFSLTGAVMLY
ncbi:UNVERIFIED_CONTAM: hypothetical protein FKN15_051116 [Acipenser sinensis]